MLIDKRKYQDIEKYLDKNVKDFPSFKVDYLKYSDTIDIRNERALQEIYEQDLNLENPKNPINLLKKIDESIQKRKEKDDMISIDVIPKKGIPIGQLYAVYCLGKIIF